MDLLWRSEPSARNYERYCRVSLNATDRTSRIVVTAVLRVFFLFPRVLTIIFQLSGPSIKSSILFFFSPCRSFFFFFYPLATLLRLCALCFRVSATLRGNVYCNVSVWCQLSRAASCLEERMTVWLCGDNVRALHLGAFLSSASLKNADIKCLMLACTTNAQIKTSAARHVSPSPYLLLLLLPSFLWHHICFYFVVSRFDSSFAPLLPFIKVWLFPKPESCQHLKERERVRTNSRMLPQFTCDLRNKCFPDQRLLLFNRACVRHDGVRA